jgi:hypothetical protein
VHKAERLALIAVAVSLLVLLAVLAIGHVPSGG